MKKNLLSAIAIAISAFGFAQTNSDATGNMPTDSYDGYTFEFNGNAAANCTSETINEGNVKASWNAQSTSIDTNGFANGQAILTVDTTDGWSTTDGFVFIFNEGNCAGINLDLSENDSVEIKINSSVASKVYIALGDTSNATLADLALFNEAIPAGESILKFEVSAWKSWDQKTVDSTNANYILMGFRVGGWGTEVIPGTYTIDYIKVGKQAEAVGFDEEEETKLTLSPNPATDVVNLGVEAQTVSVYNINGVLELSAEEVSEINVSSLKSGVYIIQTENRFGKFIKE